jgi:hypothetical protein
MVEDKIYRISKRKELRIENMKDDLYDIVLYDERKKGIHFKVIGHIRGKVKLREMS